MRLQTFLGIYESGYDRAVHLPADTRITLELYRSVDYTIPIQIVDSQGVPVDLTGNGTTVILTIKKRISDHAGLFSGSIELTAGRTGHGVFTIAATTFDFAQGGSYLWEVMLTLGGERSPVIPLSPCVLVLSGTRYSC